VRFLHANSRRRLLQRVLALAVVSLPVPGSAFSLIAPPGGAHCGEQVCRCAHHCPMRTPAERAQKAKPSCHEEAPAAATFWQPGGCGAPPQGTEAPPPVRPHVAEAAFDLGPADVGAAPIVPLWLDPAAGFRTIDLPPPRTDA
jgi:hypothetical protein